MSEGLSIPAPPLGTDASCDVVIVGAGIAGLSCAYELTRLDRSVIVVDRGLIGSGMTLRTTAHLASALDDFYSELIKVHGEAQARLYHDSQVAAINRIEAICEEIGADFARVDGFLFPATPSDLAELEEEFAACSKIGVDVEWCEHAPIPGIETGRCLRFPHQARFDPAKYLAGLAQQVVQGGGRLYAETAYISHETSDDDVVLRTESGHCIRGQAAVFATNSPVNDRVAIHTKQAPYRTYVVAGKVPKGSVVDALYWDTLEAYHYARLQPLDADSDLLIVGGEDHRTGEAQDMDERLTALADWTRQSFPSFGEVDYRWSGQVLEPIDFMPFSGRNPGDNNIYVHSGDSGQGITNGVAGALTIVPLIMGREARFAHLFDPSRKPLGGSALGEFAQGQVGVFSNITEHLGPSEVSSVDEIAPGEGAILRDGTIGKLAIYRTEQGEIVRHSATCTHMGCVVHWNTLEKCWDCPCHGSQFAPAGQVLNGPAITSLSAK
jgi:glycine/D-amino acid oxidase-like deaminating enzyme/nitrite reductase/ring-hydroxylating ferredoxin subunit